MGNNLIEKDWAEAAACSVDDPADTSFIREPVGLEEDIWALTCSKCPVFQECAAWADRLGVTSVYAAGLWRE